MRSMRHPNPLIDVRRPRHREKLGINPPGFVWRLLDGVDTYRLEVSRCRDFGDATLRGFDVVGRSLFLLPAPLEPGRWYWRWGVNARWSQVFSFEMLEDAAVVRVGSADELTSRLGEHPRAMVVRGGLGALRARWKTVRSELLALVTSEAEKLLGQSHELAEPPFLSDRSVDYNQVLIPWRQAMSDTRKFCAEMEQLAFAWLVSGDRRFAQAAATRLDSLSRWNPDGSTAITHNDEPHMAVMDAGPLVFDWVAEVLEGSRRDRILAHLARRAENTFGFLEGRGYGIRHFASHSGRMVGFLGQSGLALGGHHPRAGEWLKYILELMVSMYPVWGGEAGGWGEGLSYSSAYVRWILRFLFSLETSLGIDLYRKPFFRNHGRWWTRCLAEYAWQTPFGDGSERGVPLGAAAVITQHLGRRTGDEAVEAYGRRCEERVAASASPGASPPLPNPLVCLSEENPRIPERRTTLATCECFPDVGYVAMRRDLAKPQEDICLIFKSSPYGPVSHSHGDQNCFVLSAFGEPLLIRTGYYTGYGSPHHQNWVRQTKAHNGVTVGGVGQWAGNPDAVGRIIAFRRKRDFACATGDASRAYGDRLSRFHRHVLFVDHRYFLILDDLQSPVETTFEFHLHSIEKMTVQEKQKRIGVSRGGARLDVEVLSELDMRFYLSDLFDPPSDDPRRRGLEASSAAPDPFPPQWHVRAATVPVRKAVRVAMLLIPNRESSPETFEVARCSGDGWFGARVACAGHLDEFLIATGDAPVEYQGQRFESSAIWARDARVKWAGAAKCGYSSGEEKR